MPSNPPLLAVDLLTVDFLSLAQGYAGIVNTRHQIVSQEASLFMHEVALDSPWVSTTCPIATYNNFFNAWDQSPWEPWRNREK